MADRHHADLPEILGRQAGQYPFVDLVGAERRLVLLEPETAEPCRNVHARLPDAVNAALSPYFNLSLCANTRWAVAAEVIRLRCASQGAYVPARDLETGVGWRRWECARTLAREAAREPNRQGLLDELDRKLRKQESAAPDE